MENKARCNIRDAIVDPHKFLPMISEEKIRSLLVELDMLEEDYDREMTIMYLSGNFSTNKHLTVTALRGMHDTEIIQIICETRVVLKDEIKSRRTH